MRPTPRAALTLAALALAACSRDLTLAPPPGAPVLTAVVPSSAFSGELIELRGGPFDEDPAANLVIFPHGSARAERRTAGGLLVRVPADAGSGQLGVTTPAGSSAPSPAFTWRGLGQLRGVSVTAQTSLLQRPAGLHVVRGSLIAESALVQGLVNLGRVSTTGPFSSLQRAAGEPGHAAAGPVALYVVVSGAAGPELHRVDVATGAVTVAAGFGCDPLQSRLGVVAAASGAFPGDLLVATCGSSYAIYPATPQPDGWAPLADFAPAHLAGEDLILGERLQDAGGGLLATVVHGATQLPRLALLDFGASPPGVRWLSGPASSFYVGPFAVGSAGGATVAAAATADQRLTVVSLADPSQVLGSYETFFTRNAEEVAVTVGGTVVASSTADGLVIGIPLAGGFGAGRPQWGYRIDAPSALVADGHLVWVASAASNEVVALDEATGSVVARRDAEPQPVSLAYVPQRASLGGADVVTAGLSDLEAWVDWPIGEPTPSGGLLDLADGESFVPELMAGDAGRDRVWIAGFCASSPLGALATTALGPPEPLPNSVADLEVVEGTVIALHGAGATLLDDAGRHEALVLDQYPGWNMLSAGPGGRVVLVHAQPAPAAQVWSVAALGSGGAPELTWSGGEQVVRGLWIDGAPWLLTGPSQLTSTQAGRLLADGSLADVGPATLPSTFVASPNWRTLVAANPSGRGVIVWDADPAAGFPVSGAIDLEGTVAGLAFDERGERLFVLTRAPARFYVVE